MSFRFNPGTVVSHTCSQILSPWLGDIVDSGIVLSYQPVRLHRLEGRYSNPMPESTIPQSGTKDLATVHFSESGWDRVVAFRGRSVQPLIFKFRNSDHDCAIFQLENPTVHLTHSRTFLERRQGSIKCNVCEPSLTLTKGLDAAQMHMWKLLVKPYSIMNAAYWVNWLIAFQ